MYANAAITLAIPHFPSHVEEWESEENWGGRDNSSGETVVTTADGGKAIVHLTDQSEWDRYNHQRHLGATVGFYSPQEKFIGWRSPIVIETKHSGYTLDFSGCGECRK